MQIDYTKALHKSVNGSCHIIEYIDGNIKTSTVNSVMIPNNEAPVTFEPVFVVKSKEFQVIVCQSDDMINDKKYNVQWLGKKYQVVKSKDGIDLLRSQV